MTTLPQILEQAANLVEKGWTQGASARTPDGHMTLPTEHDAVCWCAAGAIWAITEDFEERTNAQICFRRFIGQPIAEWNDAPSRTQAEVVEALRSASLRAKARQDEGATHAS